MDRESLLAEIKADLRVAKVVALLGPRQSGKTTLARQFSEVSEMPFDVELNYFDLEDPAHLERLKNTETCSGLFETGSNRCDLTGRGELPARSDKINVTGLERVGELFAGR